MNEREAIILGALLHDIGKFVQRGLPPRSSTHTELGGKFFQDNLREKLFTSHLFSINELDEIESAIRNHHDYVKFITLADRYSAGMDRISLSEEETKSPEFERLQSLLEKLRIPVESVEGDIKKKFNFAHKLAPLSLENVFPYDRFPKKSLREEYKNLWENFVKEIKRLPTNNRGSFIFSLYYLLQKYTWCIPSAIYKSEPDISLFDHLKTTVAIAICLYDCCKGSSQENDSDFTLLCGDISGIQNFIYNITSKGAAKGLKGRSFYLQLLSEATGKYILRQIDYPITNMLYTSGGKFYLLFANKYDKELKEIQKDINDGLLKKYDGELYMALGWCSFPGADFLGNRFPPKWRLASQEANRQKKRRFAEMEYKEIFSAFGRGGIKKICEICKKEGDLKAYGKGEPKLELCEDCRMNEELGESLTKGTSYIAEVYNEKRSPKKGFKISFLKTKYYFLRTPRELTGIEAEEITLYKQNDTEFLPDGDNIATYGYKFIGGNFIPRDKDGKALTFNNFAEKSKGLKRLGVLRMDIDNLGLIFAEGFGKNGTISRFVSLSRNLSLFFEGYLNQICQKEEYEDSVFIMYSGGDDLFIVGSWDKIVDLAEDINEEFRDFACRNEYLTLSGGISLIPQKHPIYKGAQYAGEAERMAKDYKRGVDEGRKEKNAVTFLNKPVSWNDFEISRKIKDLLYSCIAEGKEDNEGNIKKLTKGILDRLRRIYLLYDRNRAVQLKEENLPLETIKDRIEYNKWLWRMVYSLDRYSRQNDIFKEDVDRIKSALIEDQFDDIKSEREIIDLIDIPTRWVEFLTREEE